MKKIYYLEIIMLTIILVACNKQNSTQTVPKSEGEPVKTQTQAPILVTPDHVPQSTPAVPPELPSATPKPVAEGKIIGEYRTRIVDNTPSRLENLKIACQNLHGIIVLPGEEFSFNDTLGSRTEEKGYQNGYVFEGKEKVEAIGGGICQISTTLYNAVMDADLKVTERHPHKRKVDYVRRGRDATVSYGELDFKFVNTKDYPVFIEAYLTSKTVVVKVVK